MKIMKKLCAIAMTAALILTLLPAMAFAEEETNVVPEEAWFMAAPYGYPGDTDLSGCYDEGDWIEVTYSDGSEVWFVYGDYEYDDPVYEEEVGEKPVVSGFLRRIKEGETYGSDEFADASDPMNFAYAYVDYDNFDSLQEGANEVPFIINVPYGEDEDGQVLFKDFEITLHIWSKVDRPIEVEFIPADGFQVEGTIGYNYLDEETFYGEGNKFEVTYEYKDDPETTTPAVGYYTAEYEYYRSEDGSVEGFYEKGDPEYERFDMSEGFECYLDKGLNKDIELTYYAYAEGLEEPEELKFKVDIDAEKYGIYTDGFISNYTGKAIKKPNFKVYNTDDELVPAKEYTYNTPTAKSMGWHTLEVKIKDEYKDKYDTDTFIVSYGIGPKSPVLSKVTAGKKSLTVKWKKMSAAQLKKIDGFYIELSTDKSFTNNYKKIKVSKKAFKSGKKLVKGLKKGKKYYVRMYSYKTVKQNGVKFKMPSKDSKVLHKKTK